MDTISEIAISGLRKSSLLAPCLYLVLWMSVKYLVEPKSY